MTPPKQVSLIIYPDAETCRGRLHVDNERPQYTSHVSRAHLIRDLVWWLEDATSSMSAECMPENPGQSWCSDFTIASHMALMTLLSVAVPPFSISQAGAACVCRSQAWDAKIVTSAWWVHASQVCSLLFLLAKTFQHL